MPGLLETHRAIDTDTHITEPAGVWVDRMSKAKWGDAIPHIEQIDGRDMWIIDGAPVGGPGYYTMAGFDDTYPASPMGYADIPASSYDAKARLAHMDKEGIYAQVLYPNVGGFGSGRFFALKDPELKLECVRAYNDFLVDWCSADPNRLVPVMATPFWDVDATITELQRCADKGVKALLHCSEPQAWDQPVIGNNYWDPVWAAASEAGMSISFHIGGGDLSDLINDKAGQGFRASFARASSLVFMGNASCIADLIFGGVCHRFPDLKFVSVESGAGWIQSLLEAFDWQWQNGGVTKDNPKWDLLPSEYFRRQILGCFWFEDQGIQKALEMYPDNLLWETDFPHPTCQHPGPATIAEHPRDYVERALSGLSEETLHKVLHSNAAALYGIK